MFLSLIKGGRFSFGPLLFHFLEYAPVSHFMQPAHTNTHKTLSLSLSAPAFFSCFKMLTCSILNPSLSAFSGEKKQKAMFKGSFLFHSLLILNIACTAFLHQNNFSSCLRAHHFLFSKTLLQSEIISVFKLHPF